MYRVETSYGYMFLIPDEQLSKGIEEIIREFTDLFEEPEDLIGIIESHLCDTGKYKCEYDHRCSENYLLCEKECEKKCKSGKDSDDCLKCQEFCDELSEKECVDIIKVIPYGSRRS
ncbi:MAG: hypothetical protein QW607_08450 [Desulfurococcaceae archaeon]